MMLPASSPIPESGKVAATANRVAELYHRHRDDLYLDPTGQPSGRPGSLQAVFCDLGTPRPGGEWSVYEELRRQLADREAPQELVRFVHEAADDQAKADLFAACREGRVAVLIGSTEKMGVGTNVQHRLAALHHLDAPWRPADIAQREGRALRQGNQNSEVAIIRYVTEGSFDVFMWQTLERKQTFVHQVMAGEIAGREIEDVGDTALSYAEVKALATGNPLIMEKAGVDSEVARLLRLRAGWQAGRPEGGFVYYVDTRGGNRAVLSRGACSVPGPRSFRNACRTHDLGYNLMRFFRSSGSGGSTRKAVDNLLFNDFKSVCGGLRWWGRPGCGISARAGNQIVAGNSWKQGYRVP